MLMKNRRLSVLLSALGAITAAALATEAAANPVMYGSGAQTVVYSRHQLTPSQQTAFRAFKASNYFGAMAINPDSGAYHWETGYSNLQNAISVAIELCGAKAKNRARTCELYATQTPSGFSGLKSSPEGLSQTGRAYFKSVYLQHQRQRKYSAFAISGMTAGASSYGEPTKSDAVNAALKECNAQERGILTKRSSTDRAVMQKSGFETCHIVDVRFGR